MSYTMTPFGKHIANCTDCDQVKLCSTGQRLFNDELDEMMDIRLKPIKVVAKA